MTSTFDPNQFKMGQRQNWDSVAEGWKQWWDAFEKGAQGLSNRLIELAKIKSGQRVLDIATGIGEPAITGSENSWYQRSCPRYRYFCTNVENCKRKNSIIRIARHNRV